MQPADRTMSCFSRPEILTRFTGASSRGILRYAQMTAS